MLPCIIQLLSNPAWHYPTAIWSRFEVLDDLEDYFHRLDARRSELEAGLGASLDEEPED